MGALSGPLTGRDLTGFGAFWLLVMARALADGGGMDDAAFWVAVGAVPLGIGLGILLLTLDANVVVCGR
jgi:hypothetical protein